LMDCLREAKSLRRPEGDSKKIDEIGYMIGAVSQQVGQLLAVALMPYPPSPDMLGAHSYINFPPSPMYQ